MFVLVLDGHYYVKGSAMGSWSWSRVHATRYNDRKTAVRQAQYLSEVLGRAVIVDDF